MKTKRILSLILALLLTLSIPALPAGAAEYDPIFVTSGGVTSTGDFDSLFSGQIIYYPADLPESQETYPVIVWANGTMCAPALYHGLLSKIAGGGYIVVTNTDVMAANGESQRKSIDFILAENADPHSVFYGKVNTGRIGAAGHSQGGRSAVNAAAADSRIDCVLSLAGSNFTSEATKLSTPTFFIAGGADMMVMASLWVKPAYNNSKGPAVYANLKGAIHTTCCLNPDAYIDYILAWFDGWLKDDTDALNTFRSGGALAKDRDWKDFAVKGF
jgi:hypothetical protein